MCLTLFLIVINFHVRFFLLCAATLTQPFYLPLGRPRRIVTDLLGFYDNKFSAALLVRLSNLVLLLVCACTSRKIYTIFVVIVWFSRIINVRSFVCKLESIFSHLCIHDAMPSRGHHKCTCNGNKYPKYPKMQAPQSPPPAALKPQETRYARGVND